MSTPVNNKAEEAKRSKRKGTKKNVSRSVLPNLRTQNTSMNKSQIAEHGKEKSTTSKANESAGKGGTDEKSKASLRNKTPVQRRAPAPGFGAGGFGGMGFPALNSSGTQRSKQMYEMNYSLDIDSQMYSTRQNSHHVGSFYKRLISNRIIPNGPTPLLAAETTAMSNMVNKNSMITKGALTVRHGNQFINMSRTIGDDMNAERDRQRINENSALDNYRQQLDVEKQTMLPSIAHLQSDDSLFGESKHAGFGGDSKLDRHQILDKHQKKYQGVSNITTDTRMNMTDLTQPHTSKHTHDQTINVMQMTIAESILRQSQYLDPLAGNSVISHLNTSLRMDAKDKIGADLNKTTRKQSQQRRRLMLAGEEEMSFRPEFMPGHFVHKGSLESVMSESSAMRTATESIADSHIYNELASDMSGFARFYEKERQKEIERDEAEQKREPAKTNMTPAQLIAHKEKLQQKRDQEEAEEMRVLRRDPEAHFHNLKAKIKLKVIKKYQEDQLKKAEDAKKAAEPVVVIKDKFGRIMEKIAPNVTSKKLPSKNRLPRKKQPPQRRLSFTESQMQYYGAADIFNPMHKIKGPTLTQKTIIDFMKQVDRFPIQECLVNRRKNRPYVLQIDSIISAQFKMSAVQEWANFMPEINAPANSQESEDNFQLIESQSSDDSDAIPYLTKDKLAQDPELEKKQFPKQDLETSGFRLQSMQYYPYRSREGEIPYKILSLPKSSFVFDSCENIRVQQAQVKWDAERIQNIFEYYCYELKAAPIILSQFYNYDDPANTKLSFRNYPLDDQTVKALAMVLPFITDITEIELNNNQMTDQVSATLVFAFFMNPYLKRISVAYNFLRQTFNRTLAKFIAMKPEKITDINLMGSVQFHDHIDPVIRELPKMKHLTSLNIAGCMLSQGSCRQLSLFVFMCFTLRMLDVSHCRISYQGSRYLIDALNRNTCIRNFNFSHNDLNSQSYEFSIKVASMITRHPCLMHLDITNTNLKREEIMFIGLAVSQSKTLLSIHLTAQKLPYYERIFLRSIMAARVGYQQKNTQMKKDVQTNKERNQVLQMASGEVQDPSLLSYLDNLKDLDEKRKGLDIQIQDMLAELDTQASYEDHDPENGQLADFPEDSKINQLVTKLVERQKELEEQQAELAKIYEQEQQNVSKRVEQLQGLQDIGKAIDEEFGSPEKQKGARKKEEQEDMFQKMRELRVERHKQRAEMEVIKENKDRSAGELALMFMGINQVAYDLLVENPMTGYMNEIIFSRVLGHDEIEEGDYWVDATQCWVCRKHNKVTLAYHLQDDREIFQQKVTQIERLHQTIENKVEQIINKERSRLNGPNDDEIEILHEAGDEVDSFTQENNFGVGQQDGSATVKNMQRRLSLTMAGKTFLEDQVNHGGTTKQGGQTVSTVGGFTQIMNEQMRGHANVLDNRSEGNQDAIIEEKESHPGAFVDEANLGLNQTADADSDKVPASYKQFMSNFASTNPLAPVKTTESQIRQFVYPEQYGEVKPISYAMPTADEMYGAELRRLNQLELQQQDMHDKLYGRQEGKVRVVPLRDNSDEPRDHQANAMALQRHYMNSKGGSSQDDPIGILSSVISYHEKKRRVRGEPSIITKQIWFQGAVYQIEEEIYSDPDNSSVYTSEDDFDVDKGLQGRFKMANPLLSDTASMQHSQTGKNLIGKLGKLDGLGAPPDKVINANAVKVIEEEAKTPASPAEDGKKLGDRKSSIKSAQENGGSKTPGRRDSQSQKRQVTINEGPQENAEGQPAEAATGEKQEAAAPALERQKSLPKQPAKKKNASYSKEKQALMREYFTNSEGLTQAQKEYEPKIAPKYYRPNLMRQRIEHHEDKFAHRLKTDKDAAGATKDNTSTLAKGNTTPQNSLLAARARHSVVQCVASFNDWMPIRMKTLRTLNVERFSLDVEEKDIPRKTFLLDNNIALCAQMVPPGYHYFYFVRDKGTIFLSPNYEVVRFKNTQIFLNRVFVAKRLEDVETVHVAKAGEEEEAVFMKDRSVFKDFREDTQAFLKKCFEEDFAFGKIPRTVKKGQDHEGAVAGIKEVLFEHYVRLCNIFDYYSGISSYPLLSWNDFTSFSTKCKILDHDKIKNADLDLILVATCVSHHQYVNSQTLDQTRYEFLEMIVRVADFRFVQTKQEKVPADAVVRVLEEMIYPHAISMDGENFRRYHCYAVKVNEILKKNESQIKKVYTSFTHQKKKYVTKEECTTFLRKVGLTQKISELYVGAIYAESMMTIQDTIRDPIRPNQMKYVEFLVFLCRVAFEFYRTTPYHDELLYLKLDKLMPSFLAYMSLQPNFLFGDKFAAQEEQERLIAKRQRQKLKRAQARAKRDGTAVDPALLAAVKAQEEAQRKTGMGSFKASQMGGPILDSDSEGVSTDEDPTRLDDRAGSGISPETHGLADEANQAVQNADLEQDIGSSGPIGVVIEAPDRQTASGDQANASTMMLNAVEEEIVVEDLAGEDEGEIDEGGDEVQQQASVSVMPSQIKND